MNVIVGAPPRCTQQGPTERLGGLTVAQRRGCGGDEEVSRLLRMPPAAAAGARDRLGRTLTMVMVGTARSIGCVLLLLLLLAAAAAAAAVAVAAVVEKRRGPHHRTGSTAGETGSTCGDGEEEEAGKDAGKEEGGSVWRLSPLTAAPPPWDELGGCGASGPAPGPVRSGGGGGRGGGGSVEEGGGEARRGRRARGAVPSCVEDGVARRFPGLPPALWRVAARGRGEVRRGGARTERE